MFSYCKADIARLDDGRATVRGLLRGLLSQGFQAILVYRFFSWWSRKGISLQPLRFLFERCIEITTGISIPAACSIGKGFRIHHFGGVILHPSVQIGENCTMYHQVTIGDRGGIGNAAQIGNNVMIGAGAKIIGEIVIGDNCRIGANAVVNKNVPANCIAVGNPATIKKVE
jgi:serine O-acetyltransferase